jgi:hypothetical protein
VVRVQVGHHHQINGYTVNTLFGHVSHERATAIWKLHARIYNDQLAT